MFLSSKDQTYDKFVSLVRKMERQTGHQLVTIRSDHGTEFKNSNFISFCHEHGVVHNFSTPRTPQQNGVVERKNRTLEDMARTMLIASNLPKYFWAEAVSTACYIINRVMIRPILKKTPYELFKGRKPNITHFRTFGSKCFVHNNGKDNLGKFDARSDEGTFLGYSSNSKAYRVYNKRTMCIEESIHVVFNESNALLDENLQDDDYELGLAREKEIEKIVQETEETGGEPGSAEPEEGREQEATETGGTMKRTCFTLCSSRSIRTIK
ncbi:hypothetical protein Dimus_038569 [Dionaea muscipula]